MFRKTLHHSRDFSRGKLREARRPVWVNNFTTPSSQGKLDGLSSSAMCLTNPAPVNGEDVWCLCCPHHTQHVPTALDLLFVLQVCLPGSLRQSLGDVQDTHSLKCLLCGLIHVPQPAFGHLTYFVQCATLLNVNRANMYYTRQYATVFKQSVLFCVLRNRNVNQHCTHS